MKKTDLPIRIDIPWARDASGSFVRNVPNTTIDPTAASWTLGWPPDVATPVGAGGTPPDVRDENGSLARISAWSRWQAAGGPEFYDATFSTSIGGYPKGSVLDNLSILGSYWISTVDDNTSNPDTGGANWIGFSAIQPIPTGSMMGWPTTTVPAGWLERNGASLSTTTYASLFALLGYTFGGFGAVFNLPDDRGLFERNWSHGTGIDPGRTFGSVQAFDIQSHIHGVPYYSNNSPSDGPGHGGSSVSFINSGATGGTETRPVNRAYMPIIKY